ncbi:crossover junction endodeoxyribonuclease RuvC [Globicatella sanguinis]
METITVKVIAFDQSTTATGYCIMDYETSEIIESGVYEPTGATNVRIRKTVKKCMRLCAEHQPTFVFIEGIQIQQNPKVYEILAKLQGTLEICLEEKGYIVNVVKSSEWRNRVGIKRIGRKNLKQDAMDMVEEIYHIKPSEDECEAILFARAFTAIVEESI